MIPKNITREHVIKAIEEIETSGFPAARTSRKFLLKYNGKDYPPKYVLSIANKYANGKKLTPNDLSGGRETNGFLQSLRFEIECKTTGEKISYAEPMRKEKEISLRKGHSERCRECKETIKKLLEKIYGKVEKEKRFDVGALAECFKDTAYYENLKEIYMALQKHRGFNELVKDEKLRPADLFVENPGFIFEYDESQHFTQPRKIALEHYPESLELGFDKKRWIGLCDKINNKDSTPPYRDEQRAWYETIRDFLPAIKGFKPTVRVFMKDFQWCSLNPNNPEHVKAFRDKIEVRQHGETKDVTAESSHERLQSLKIGLVFPELEKHKLEDFLPIVRKYHRNLNLLIFPEGFETVVRDERTEPEAIANISQIKKISEKYHRVCVECKLSIILGVQVDYQNTSINGSGNDQYCLFVGPGGEPNIYHKHSSSRFNAFFDENWSVESNFMVRSVKDVNVGISICHDMYISLIPKVLKKKGTDVWVNISFQNVRPSIWESVLQTRAVENKFLAICTLHRNSRPKKGEGRPQKEPYAFSETGKIRLRDLETDTYIDSIPEKARTGKIYLLDTSYYENIPTKQKSAGELARKARTITVFLGKKRQILVRDREHDYDVKRIGIEEFLLSPENLWRIVLEEREKTTLFVVQLRNRMQWETYRERVIKIIKGRVIEFSTLFLFTDNDYSEIFMAAYRSSNYKESRIFYPKHFPVKLDERYLMGMESTFDISLGDPRGSDEEPYFERVNKLIDFIQK